jgi:glycosyltransferase involved in cell wall biosynthesis
VAPPLRIDFVSPLPPVRSGIADYSADLLPHLAALPELAELRVVRLPGQPVAEAVATRFAPVEAAETGAAADGAPRLPLYQMGNNHHHAPVLELALERPGVLTLHDLFLHHLLAELTLAGDTADPYVEALERDHGWVGRAVATPRRWGGWTEGGTFALPAHRGLVLGQRGVLVHSRWAAGLLAEEVPEAAVRVVPMGIPLPPRVGPPGGAEARAARRTLGLPEDRPLLGSFGFQTPIKRTLAAVRALARPELASAGLLVVGEVSPHVDLEGEARRAGVAGRVHVTGFVDAATFHRALTACDLALNLRYPTAGETSASLLRLLAAGRPALVSDYAQFRELPAAAVERVPLGAGEEAALAATAAALLADPRRLRAMGEAARDHVALHHAPPAAAAAVAAACAELATRRPPVAPGEEAPPPEVPPPTSATWRRLQGEVTVELAAAEAGRGSTVPLTLDVGSADSTAWAPGERRGLVLRLANRGPSRWLAARRGPGGVAFAVSLTDAAGRELEPGRAWLLLPRDLPPGGEAAVPFELRRPYGPARLTIEPVVFDDWGGAAGRRPGPLRWEGELR